MKDNTLSKLGGTLSILVGISYVIIGVAYVLAPADQKPGANATQLVPSLAQNSTWLLIEYWAFALGALLALGAVLAISETVRGANEGWLRWASNLAIVGFAVTAINYFRLLAVQPLRAMAYVAGDASTKAALAVGLIGARLPSPAQARSHHCRPRQFGVHPTGARS